MFRKAAILNRRQRPSWPLDVSPGPFQTGYLSRHSMNHVRATHNCISVNVCGIRRRNNPWEPHADIHSSSSSPAPLSPSSG